MEKITKGLNMNFYPHHIGDFNHATRHLTRVERSVYRDALELYYDTEKPLFIEIDKLQRKLLCASDDEKTALNDVLNEFFIKTDDGYVHERCDIEIAKYRANIGAKAKAGIASATKRQQNSTRVQQNSTAVHNQEPLTINQEPLTIKKSLSAQKAQTSKKGTRLTPEWVLSKFLGDWALSEKPHLTADNVRRMAESFRDYWIATPGAKGVKLDWEATWRNWVRKDTTDWKKSTGGAIATSIAPIKHICEVENCGKPANVKTSKGHRCAGHIAK